MSGLRKLFSGDLFKREKGPSGELSDRDFAVSYNQQLIAEYAPFRGQGGALKLDFDKLFVDPRIAFAQNPGKVHSNPNNIKELAGKRSLWDFLRNPRLPDPMALALIGPSGVGKTTVVQHLLLTMAHGRHERYGARPYTPVLLSGDDVIAWAQDKNEKNSPLQIRTLIAQRHPSLAPPEGFFQRLLEKGEAMVLIDGLDEAGDLSQRKAAAAWLDKQMTAFPRSRFIVTARPQGYRDAPLKQAWVLDLQPFSGEQARRLIESFYHALETGDAQARKSADLLHRLRVLPALSAMTTSPLLLMLIARLHREKGSLPQSRADLYARICESLLGFGPRPERHDKELLPAQKKLSVLRVLASAMMKRRVRDLKAPDAIRAVAPLLEKLGITGGDAAAEAFLQEARDAGSLLVEREVGSYRFAHQTLQEYLAAAYMLQKKDPNRQWETMVGDSWWHETLVLYCAQSDATPVVESCLNHGTMTALSVCSEILEEAHTLDPQVRTTAQDRLALESPETRARIAAMEDTGYKGQEKRELEKKENARCKLAAEVRLARRLKSLQRIDDQRDIDPEFVSCAEYQLFLDEMRERGHYSQPDHWTSLQFPQGQSAAPLAGIRSEDARDFCVWLSMRQGGNNMRFRLPRPEEARQFPANDSNLSAWCADGEQYSLVGLQQKTEQAIRDEIAKLPLLALRPSIPLERDLNRELDMAFDKEVIRALNLELDPALDKAVVHAVGHVRELIMNRAFDLGVVISPDLDLARVLARARAIQNIATAVDKYDLALAKKLLEQLKAESDDDETMARFASLLLDILTAVGAETVQEVQQAQRRYMAQFADMVYRYTGEVDPNQQTQRRQMLQVVLEFQGWLHIVMSRSAGKLPAWEGIRLVRETAGPYGVLPKLSLGLPTWAYNA